LRPPLALCRTLGSRMVIAARRVNGLGVAGVEARNEGVWRQDINFYPVGLPAAERRQTTSHAGRFESEPRSHRIHPNLSLTSNAAVGHDFGAARETFHDEGIRTFVIPVDRNPSPAACLSCQPRFTLYFRVPCAYHSHDDHLPVGRTNGRLGDRQMVRQL